MPEWLDMIGQEWPVITAAPISLSIAAVVITVIVWAIIHWFYRWLLSSKNIQIEMLRGRLADYRNVLEGASPNEAGYKIAQLKAQLKAIKGVPRDDNAVYQHGKRIGEVAGVRIDASRKSLVFDRLTLGSNLDQTTILSFEIWYWRSPELVRLVRPVKGAPYSTLNFLSSVIKQID
jgi:hypothetical protein